MGGKTTLSFPGLGIGEFQVNSTAFTVFGVSIAWYALIITFGMICAVMYLAFRAKQIGIVFDDILDFVIFAIPIGIIGARVYYVLAEIDRYDSFAEMINIRNGGLAIYGGIIAGTLAVIGVSHYKKINFFAIADSCTPGIILAQAIGRWGNFMNGEAHGGETTIFCRMGIQKIGSEMIYVHPTFLYESLWNLIGFILINIFYKHKKYDGQILFMVFGWYGLGRMFIEGLRTDSLYTQIFGLEFRTSQVLAGIIFAVCLVLLIYFAIKPPKKEFYRKVPAENKETDKNETPKISFKERLNNATEFFKSKFANKKDNKENTSNDDKDDKEEKGDE